MHDLNFSKRSSVLRIGLLVLLTNLGEGRPQSCSLVDGKLGMLSCCFQGTSKCDKLLPKSSFPLLKLWSSETLTSAQQILSENQNSTAETSRSLPSLPSYAMDKSRVKQVEIEALLADSNKPKNEGSDCCCREFRQVSAQNEGISETGRTFQIYQEYPERLQIRMNSICVPQNCGVIPTKCTQNFTYIPQFVISEEFPDYLKLEQIRTERGCDCSCHMCPNQESKLEPSKLFKRLANDSDNPEPKVPQNQNETSSLHNHDESFHAKNKFIKKSLLEFQSPASKNYRVESSVIVQKLSELIQKVLEKFQEVSIQTINDSNTRTLEIQKNKSANLSETLDDAANLLSIASDLLTFRRNAEEPGASDNPNREFKNSTKTEKSDLQSLNILKQIKASNLLEENGTVKPPGSSSATTTFNFITEKVMQDNIISSTNFSVRNNNTKYPVKNITPQLQFIIQNKKSNSTTKVDRRNDSIEIKELYRNIISDNTNISENMAVTYNLKETATTLKTERPTSTVDDKKIDHFDINSSADSNFTLVTSHPILMATATSLKMSETTNATLEQISDSNKLRNFTIRNFAKHSSVTDNFVVSAMSTSPGSRSSNNSFSAYTSNVPYMLLISATEHPETTQINRHNGALHQFGRTTNSQKLLIDEFQINNSDMVNSMLASTTANPQFQNGDNEIFVSNLTTTNVEAATLYGNTANIDNFNSSEISVIPSLTTTAEIPVTSPKHVNGLYQMENSQVLSKYVEPNEELNVEINRTQNEFDNLVSTVTANLSEFLQPLLASEINLPMQTTKPVKNSSHEDEINTTDSVLRTIIELPVTTQKESLLSSVSGHDQQGMTMAGKGNHSFGGAATHTQPLAGFSEIFKPINIITTVLPTTGGNSFNKVANANLINAPDSIFTAATELLDTTTTRFSVQLDEVNSSRELTDQEEQQEVIENKYEVQKNVKNDSFANGVSSNSFDIFQPLLNTTESQLITITSMLSVLQQVENDSHSSKSNENNKEINKSEESINVTKLYFDESTKKMDHFGDEIKGDFQEHSVTSIFIPVIPNATNMDNLWTTSGAPPMDTQIDSTERDRLNYDKRTFVMSETETSPKPVIEDKNVTNMEKQNTSTFVSLNKTNEVNFSTSPNYRIQTVSSFENNTSFFKELHDFTSTLDSAKFLHTNVQNSKSTIGISEVEILKYSEALLNTENIQDKISAVVESKTERSPTNRRYEVWSQKKFTQGLNLTENSSNNSFEHSNNSTTASLKLETKMVSNLTGTNVDDEIREINKNIANDFISTETSVNRMAITNGNQKTFGVTLININESRGNISTHKETNSPDITRTDLLNEHSEDNFKLVNSGDSVLLEDARLRRVASDSTSEYAERFFTNSSTVSQSFSFVGADGVTKYGTDYANKFENGVSDKLVTFSSTESSRMPTFTDNLLNLINKISTTEQKNSYSSTDDNDIVSDSSKKFLEDSFVTEHINGMYSTVSNSQTTSRMENGTSLPMSSSSIENMTEENEHGSYSISDNSILPNENVSENFISTILSTAPSHLIFNKNEMNDANKTTTMNVTPHRTSTTTPSLPNESSLIAEINYSNISIISSEVLTSTKSYSASSREADHTFLTPFSASLSEVKNSSTSSNPNSNNLVPNFTTTMKTQRSSQFPQLDNQFLKINLIDQNSYKFQSLQLLNNYLNSETEQRKMFWDAAEKLFDTEKDHLVENKLFACPTKCTEYVNNVLEDLSSAANDYKPFAYKTISHMVELILTEAKINKEPCNNEKIVVPDSVKEFLKQVKASPLTLKLVENLFQRNAFNYNSVFNGQLLKMVAVGEVMSSVMNPLFNEIIKLFHQFYNSNDLLQFKELILWAARSHNQSADVIADELPMTHTYEILKEMASLRKEIKNKTFDDNLTSCRPQVIVNVENNSLENGTFSELPEQRFTTGAIFNYPSNTASSELDTISTSTEFSTLGPIYSSTESSTLNPIYSSPESLTLDPIYSSTESSTLDPIYSSTESSTLNPIYSTTEFSTLNPTYSNTESSSLDASEMTTEALLRITSSLAISTSLNITNTFRQFDETTTEMITDLTNEIPLTIIETTESSIIHVTTEGFGNEAFLRPNLDTLRNRTRIGREYELPENFKPINFDLDDVIKHMKV